MREASRDGVRVERSGLARLSLIFLGVTSVTNSFPLFSPTHAGAGYSVQEAFKRFTPGLPEKIRTPKVEDISFSDGTDSGRLCCSTLVAPTARPRSSHRTALQHVRDGAAERIGRPGRARGRREPRSRDAAHLLPHRRIVGGEGAGRSSGQPYGSLCRALLRGAAVCPSKGVQSGRDDARRCRSASRVALTDVPPAGTSPSAVGRSPGLLPKRCPSRGG